MFKDVKINHDGAADLLPENGVPDTSATAR